VTQVSDYDSVAYPIIELSNDTLRQEPELRASIGAIFVSSAGAFAGMVTAAIIKYWLGVPNSQGYIWFSPLFDKFSCARLEDLVVRKGFVTKS
jgi:hypothetical protein